MAQKEKAGTNQAQPDFIPASQDQDFIPADSGPVTAGETPQPASWLSAGLRGAGETLSDLAQGVGEGALNTVHGTGELLRKGGNYIHAGLGDKIIPPVGQNSLKAIATPDNTTQAIGKGVEQTGEMLLPGAGEEAALGKGAGLIPKILYHAGTTGALNKLQGGDFSTGAAGGAGGELLGAGLQKAAPALAETALGVGNKLRGRGRTIGKAILEETSGVRPETIAQQAGKKLGGLTGELERRASAFSVANNASTNPAHAVIDNAIAKSPRNATGYIQKLESLKPLLDFNQGAGPQRRAFTPAEILEMKRGVDKEISSWSPEIRKGVEGVKHQIYHALDSELDRTVPGSKELNQRISSLIPAKQRAEAITRNAGLTQRVAHRIGAHTGALTGALGGGMMGYRKGGAEGAVGGAALGLVLPELLSSPSGKMALARGANSPIIPRILVSSGLQADRPKVKGQTE